MKDLNLYQKTLIIAALLVVNAIIIVEIIKLNSLYNV